MSRFEAILQKYRERTARRPSDLIETRVLSRLDRRGGGAANALTVTRYFPPLAIAAGLAIGVMLSAATPIGFPASPTIPELAVFSPDAPHLPSTWLD